MVLSYVRCFFCHFRFFHFLIFLVTSLFFRFFFVFLFLSISPLLLSFLLFLLTEKKKVADGTREFTPSPEETRDVVSKMYRARRTIMIRFENDSIDESEGMKDVIQEGKTLLRMRVSPFIFARKRDLDFRAKSVGLSLSLSLSRTLAIIFFFVDKTVKKGCAKRKSCISVILCVRKEKAVAVAVAGFRLPGKMFVFAKNTLSVSAFNKNLFPVLAAAKKNRALQNGRSPSPPAPRPLLPPPPARIRLFEVVAYTLSMYSSELYLFDFRQPLSGVFFLYLLLVA